MKKIFSTLAVLFLGVFLIGMITSDPNGSRTSTSSSNDNHSPVIQTNNIVKFSDDMNGTNDSAGLRARGWIPKRGPLSGPAGLSPNWFQGNTTVFNAYEGPATGYVGANFQNTTGTNTIDLWLISPPVDAAAGDTVSLWSRSPDASIYPDSIRIYWSATGDTVPGSGAFVEIGKFQVSTAGWSERRYTLPTGSATGRFAINYRVAGGGPTGNNSDYIGVDLVRVLGPSTVGITPINNQVPSAYSLKQNYPNPFNPTTNINFSIPVSGMVKLSVFDMSGKEVATIVNGDVAAGNYAVNYNASQLSSGVYFYKLTSANFTDTKKMMLVK
ncbi:MAG: choice-of-anchor J domain-containing protein [Ignavibacteria bacterium]